MAVNMIQMNKSIKIKQTRDWNNQNHTIDTGNDVWDVLITEFIFIILEIKINKYNFPTWISV